MKNGKYSRKGSKRTATLLLALVLLLGCGIGGTLAYLTATPKEVTNTFTVGDIGTLTLNESDTDTVKDGVQHEYTIIPGVNITKDPVVVYDHSSHGNANENGDFGVPVYVFVKIENDNWDMSQDGMTYKIGNDLVKFEIFSGTAASEGVAEVPGWTHLKDGVYYIALDKDTSLAGTSVIKGNTITVSANIVRSNVKTVADAANSLKFTAYAIQQGGFATVEAAWDEVSN